MWEALFTSRCRICRRPIQRHELRYRLARVACSGIERGLLHRVRRIPVRDGSKIETFLTHPHVKPPHSIANDALRHHSFRRNELFHFPIRLLVFQADIASK
jgi:hypothetical protein